jgi:DNA-binding LacI/PurR family transcriptional regulator
MVSLREIARQLGVSHATVSMALRNDCRISSKRRQEIQDRAAKLGYRPDPLLKQLAAYRKSCGTVPVESCIAWLNDWDPPRHYYQFREFHNYWHGAVAAAERLGYRLEEFRLREFARDGENLSRVLAARGIRGVVIPPHSKQQFRFSSANWRDLAVVKIGFSISDLPAHTAGADQYAGGRIAALKMLQAGRQRIGCVLSEDLERNTRGNFAAGFLQARDSRIPKKQRITTLRLDTTDMRKARKSFLDWFAQSRPDAILFSSAPIERWVRAAGGKVPNQVALAAISILDSPITAGLDQLPREVGRAAVELVDSMIVQRQFGLPEHPRCLLIDPVWVFGKECPPPKKEKV